MMNTGKWTSNNEVRGMHHDCENLQARRRQIGMSEIHNQATGSTSLISLPYYAPESVLPAPLPSIAEIEESREILRERTAAKVVAVGSHFVVKYGQNISLEEGRTMKFVEDCAGIPVPRLYALYCELGKNYIVMERIDGKTLQDTWQEYNKLEKDEIATQIKIHLQNLRAVPSPGGYCSLDSKPLRDVIFWTGRRHESLGCDGPFDSEADLINAIVKKCKASEILKGKASFYEDCLPLVFRNHSPVLTHGDLQRKNIMRKAKSKSIVFLDWEFAGWYPTFWEFAQAMCGCGHFEDDWHRCVGKMLDPFLSEYAWLNILQLEIGY